jgi:hypothetical protein
MGAPSLNDSASKGINGAGFQGEEVNPSSKRVEVEGDGASSRGGDREQQASRRR